MVLYPNKLPESERVCFGICNDTEREDYTPEVFEAILKRMEEKSQKFYRK